MLLLVVIFIIIGAVAFTMFMKKEKFVGDFSYDSGFYAVDRAMGGSGILEDAINQSRTDDPNADF